MSNIQKGQIIKIISNDYTVLKDESTYVCKSRGKFRNLNIKPLVGDYVHFNVEDRYIMEVLPRKNELIRPLICNVDQAIIVTSVKHPDFSTNLLDKLLVIMEFNQIKPIICITKMDLVNQKESILEEIKYYQKIGYEIYFNDDLETFSTIFKHKISVVTGQSGAGKSTLLNLLSPELSLKTNEISFALGRGKHTTRHVELIEIAGGYIADTPGFSAISFDGMSASDIRDNFTEFNDYKTACKYRDCMHIKEDGCAIKTYVKEGIIKESRHENYVKFVQSKG